MRNLENEKKWAKEKYGRLDTKLEKELVETFKKYLKNKNIPYRQWVEQKIKEELKIK